MKIKIEDWTDVAIPVASFGAACLVALFILTCIPVKTREGVVIRADKYADEVAVIIQWDDGSTLHRNLNPTTVQVGDTCKIWLSVLDYPTYAYCGEEK